MTSQQQLPSSYAGGDNWEWDSLYEQGPYYANEGLEAFINGDDATFEQWDVRDAQEPNGLSSADLPELSSQNDSLAETDPEDPHFGVPWPPYDPTPSFQSTEGGVHAVPTDRNTDPQFVDIADPSGYRSFEECAIPQTQPPDHQQAMPAGPPFLSEINYDLDYTTDQSLQPSNSLKGQIVQLQQEMTRRNRKMDRMFNYLEELQRWTMRYHYITDRLLQNCGLAEDLMVAEAPEDGGYYYE